MFIHFFSLILALILAISSTGIAQDSPIIAAYYQNTSQNRPAFENRPPFTAKNIPAHLITDVYFAFAIFGYIPKTVDANHPGLTGDFALQPIGKDDQSVLYGELIALKESSKGLRLILSIGGWGFNDREDPEDLGQHTYRLFSRMISKPANRAQFIYSAISYAHRHGFDGIDIDWEYPGDSTRGGAPEDFDRFLDFLKECSTAFHSASPPLILSYCVPATVPYGLPAAYKDDPTKFYQWVAKCANYLDRITLMAYDYHGAFDIPRITGVNAPLNHDTNPESHLFITNSIRNYVSNGTPPKKIVLGIPFYGSSYGGVTGLSLTDSGPGKPFETKGKQGPSTNSPGLLAYYEIADMIVKKQLNFGSNTLTGTVYGYSVSNQFWVSFDNPDTIRLKAQKAKDEGLAGVVVWSIDMDEYNWPPKFPNMKSAHDVFHSKD